MNIISIDGSISVVDDKLSGLLKNIKAGPKDSELVPLPFSKVDLEPIIEYLNYKKIPIMTESILKIMDFMDIDIDTEMVCQIYKCINDRNAMKNKYTNILDIEIEYNSRKAFYTICHLGDRDLVDYIIDRGVVLWASGLEGACAGGHTDLVYFMIEKIIKTYNESLVYRAFSDCSDPKQLGEWDKPLADYWDAGLTGACRGGHKQLAKLMIGLGATDRTTGIISACIGNQKEMIEFMLSLNLDLDVGLYGACYSGNMDLVELMIKKGAGNYNRGLCGLLHSGRNYNEAIYKLMIDNGASEWPLDTKLKLACSISNSDSVNWAVENKVNVDIGLSIACSNKRIGVANYMISLGAKETPEYLKLRNYYIARYTEYSKIEFPTINKYIRSNLVDKFISIAN